MNEDLKFGVLLKAARTLLGMSLKEMGEELNVSSVSVAKWENGDVPLKAITLHAIERFFKANGIIIELNDQKEPVIRIIEPGMKLIEENPKNPPYKTMAQIYEEDRRQPSGQSVDLIQRYGMEALQEQMRENPNLLKEFMAGLRNQLHAVKKEQGNKLEWFESQIDKE